MYIPRLLNMRCSINLALLFFLITFSACGDGKSLTTAKAQTAIDQWAVQGKGKCVVQGIQELPDQNAARVDCTVTGLTWESRYVGKQTYDGPVVAMFSRYSDGRWVLTNITLPNLWGAAWQPNITVK